MIRSRIADASARASASVADLRGPPRSTAPTGSCGSVDAGRVDGRSADSVSFGGTTSADDGASARTAALIGDATRPGMVARAAIEAVRGGAGGVDPRGVRFLDAVTAASVRGRCCAMVCTVYGASQRRKH
jgi:hypothetical protein